MDYSDDSCMDQFANDQMERIHAMWSFYRNAAIVKGILGQSKIRDHGEWDVQATFTLLANEADANLSGITVEATFGGTCTSCQVPSGRKECTTDWVLMKTSPSPVTIEVICLVFLSIGTLFNSDLAGRTMTAFVSK